MKVAATNLKQLLRKVNILVDCKIRMDTIGVLNHLLFVVEELLTLYDIVQGRNQSLVRTPFLKRVHALFFLILCWRRFFIVVS